MLKDNLRTARLMCALSQTEVANKLQITRQAYNNYETGIRIPDADTISKLADCFGVSTDYLLGRDEEDVEIKKMIEDIKSGKARSNVYTINGSNGVGVYAKIPEEDADELEALIRTFIDGRNKKRDKHKT